MMAFTIIYLSACGLAFDVKNWVKHIQHLRRTENRVVMQRADFWKATPNATIDYQHVRLLWKIRNSSINCLKKR